ncbi:MAG: hypothetical protein V3U03_07035 [Myxococcota bacterium]
MAHAPGAAPASAGSAAFGSPAAGARRWPRAWPLLLFVAFAALDLAVFRHALHGEFVSDDFGYVVNNPYASALSAENVAALFDPRSPAQLYAVGNYAPIHALLHVLERQIFADEVLGYHLVNVLLHALNSVLLVTLLLWSRVPPLAALLGGLLFALHPANVEAVAWISQLKSSAGLTWALAALLVHRRHPALSAPLFALGLLTKAAAVFALPMAAAFSWARRGAPGGDARHWAWLGVWALVLGLYAFPQLAAFGHVAAVEVPAYDEAWVQLRSIAAIGARYLVMAATSYGVSAFHEPSPLVSLFDPWWLAALPAAALLGWRTLACLRRGSDEGAYWIGAAASYAPISQIFPFVHPIADRYLYFILPGLIGGTLLFAVEWRQRLAARRSSGAQAAPSPLLLSRVALTGAAALALLFAYHSAERARLWRNETRLLVDAANHYPEGGTASFLRGRRAAQLGDVDGAVVALREAADRGVDRFAILVTDPGLAPIQREPAFRELVRELARRWIARAQARGHSTPADLRAMALAHVELEEYGEAEAWLERALEGGGPLEPVLRADLAALRARRAEWARRGEGEGHRPQSP